MKTSAQLNEADRFLIENWEEAQRLSNAMEEVRGKLTLILGNRVQELLKDRDWWDTEEFEWLNNVGADGWLGFYVKRWSRKGKKGRPAFWVGNISPDKLFDEDDPYAMFHLERCTAWSDLEKIDEALGRLRNKKMPKARKIGQLQVIVYDLPEGRDGILKLLQKDDITELARVIVSHFDKLATLISGIDKVLCK